MASVEDLHQINDTANLDEDDGAANEVRCDSMMQNLVFNL